MRRPTLQLKLATGAGFGNAEVPCPKLLLWFAQMGRLLTANLLYKRRDGECPVGSTCGSYAETITHALRYCNIWVQGWHHLVGRNRPATFLSHDNHAKWIVQDLKECFGDGTEGTDWRYIFREAIRTFWFWRNNLFHDARCSLPPTVEIAYNILIRVRNGYLTSLPLFVNIQNVRDTHTDINDRDTPLTL